MNYLCGFPLLSDGQTEEPLQLLGEDSWEEFSIAVPWGTVEGESPASRFLINSIDHSWQSDVIFDVTRLKYFVSFDALQVFY